MNERARSDRKRQHALLHHEVTLAAFAALELLWRVPDQTMDEHPELRRLRDAAVDAVSALYQAAGGAKY